MFSSGGGAFGSASTRFSETNGSFTLDGLEYVGGVAFGVLDTPGGGSTALIDGYMPFGGGSPSTITLASSVSSSLAVGGGSQSNGDVAWGTGIGAEVNLGQLQNGSTTLSPPLNTGVSGLTQTSAAVSDGIALVVGLANSGTPSTLFGTACFSNMPIARIERGRCVGSICPPSPAPSHPLAYDRRPAKRVGNK